MKSRSLIVNPPPPLPTTEGGGPHLSMVLTGTVCLIIGDALVARGGRDPVGILCSGSNLFAVPWYQHAGHISTYITARAV